MIIKLDKHTCEKFLNQGITDVAIDIIAAGCAGSKVSVSEHVNIDRRIPSEEHLGVRCWIKPDLAEKLDGAQIAQAKGKYFLVSKQIQSRCGCGTSFSFEKKTVSKDLAKIHRLQSALKLSPEIVHLRQALKTKKSA